MFNSDLEATGKLSHVGPKTGGTITHGDAKLKMFSEKPRIIAKQRRQEPVTPAGLDGDIQHP